MKKHEVAALYEQHIADLHKKIEHVERQKKQFATEVYHIRTYPKHTPTKRNLNLYKYMRGRSYDDWMSHYDDHIETLHAEAQDYRKQLHEYSRPEPNRWAVPVAMVLVLGLVALGVFSMQGSVTSFTVANTIPAKAPHAERGVAIDVPALNLSNETTQNAAPKPPEQPHDRS